MQHIQLPECRGCGALIYSGLYCPNCASDPDRLEEERQLEEWREEKAERDADQARDDQQDCLARKTDDLRRFYDF